jgi:rhodanese-related sulfurtransferase
LTVQQISREDLQALLDAGGVTLVEALPAPHFDAEHPPGAVNLPGELIEELAPDPTRTVVTYCSGPSCGRSNAAAAASTRLGYADVHVYVGGKANRARAGLPFEGARALPRV